MKKRFLILAVIPALSACSTLGESMQLGASMGAVGGAAALYSSQRSVGQEPTLESVGSGALIGLGVGLITSYITHKSTEENRQYTSNQPEMYFGDIPPSPFVLPKTPKKGGK